MTYSFQAAHLETLIALPADPAIAAIGAFHACSDRFDALVEAIDLASGELLALDLEPGSLAYDQARTSLGLPALDENERLLGDEHDATLAAALATIPRTMEGVMALAELLQDQGRQGAPTAMMDLGSASIVAALGGKLT